MKRFLILLLLGCTSGGQAPPPVLLLWADLTPGPHPVGYRVADGDVSIWHPATASGERLRFRDYITTLDEWDKHLHHYGASDETIVALFDSPMYARHDAPPLPHTFPAVLIAQGSGQDAADQAVLAEYIASHGFIVATAADLERAARAGGKPVAVIAHGSGARAMLRYASRNPVNALISLDGEMGTEPIAVELPPLLHLYGEDRKPDTAFLGTLRTRDLRVERVPGLRHVHFSSWGFAATAFPELAKATKALRGTRAGVTDAAQRALRFISTVTPRP